MSDPVFSFRIHPQEKEKLKVVAKKRRMSMSDTLRLMIVRDYKSLLRLEPHELDSLIGETYKPRRR